MGLFHANAPHTPLEKGKSMAISATKVRIVSPYTSWGQGGYPAFRGEVCVLARLTHDACYSARHAVDPGEVQSRTRYQLRQTCDEVEWVEDDVGRAVAKRLLEPIDDLSPIIGQEPLVGAGGLCDVATELFELVALVSFTDGVGVERKPGNHDLAEVRERIRRYVEEFASTARASPAISTSSDP